MAIYPNGTNVRFRDNMNNARSGEIIGRVESPDPMAVPRWKVAEKREDGTTKVWRCSLHNLNRCLN